jgi:hypothetical protein
VDSPGGIRRNPRYYEDVDTCGKRFARLGMLLCFATLVPRIAICWKPWPHSIDSIAYSLTHDAMVPYLIGIQSVGVTLTFAALFLRNEGYAIKAFAAAVCTVALCWWGIIPKQLA